MRLLSNLHVKGKPAVLPDRAIRRQSHYFIYRSRTWNDVIPYKGRMIRVFYLSRVDHARKIRDRKQKTDIGKYSFVNRTIKN